jgi:ABC-type transporter Mla subunit MlaD
MSDLEVDLDGLVSFASGLDRIRSQLDRTGDFLDAYRDDVGSDKLANRLDHFKDHWDDGREKITSNAESLSSMVHESVDTYRRTDDELSQAIQQSTEGG